MTFAKRNARSDRFAALADLGKPEEIGKVFVGFQKYLYRETVVA